MVSASAVRDYLAELVHPSVAGDEVEAARHQGFIASHLAGGVLAFAALPLVLLARGGVPSSTELIAFAWLVAPIVAALDLSRTGRLDRAHLISAISLAGLIFVIAAITGGVSSFAIVWLAIVPFEAAFSNCRRVIGAATAAAVGVTVALAGLGYMGSLPEPIALGAGSEAVLSFIALLAAALYSGGLAARWETIQSRIRKVGRDNEERYAVLARNMSDLITRHSLNGRVVFASPAAETLLGLPSRNLIGQGLFERVHVADRPAYLTALSDASRLGQSSSVEFRMRRATEAGESGQDLRAPEHVWVEMRAHCMDNAGTEIVAVTRDISDRKAQESELLAAREEADRANAAKGRFLASMSHELRTPLNAIIGFSEILSTEGLAHLDDERRKEYAGLIHGSGLHLLEVVNGILDMSKIESGAFAVLPEPFALGPVIDNCTQLFALKAAAARVHVAIDIEPMLPELVADRRACKQVLLNLLSNAIKFTPAGGRITVSARHEDGETVMAVSDTGVGISEEDLPWLGQAFYQARGSYDRPYEGTGLGLSVVKGLMDLHGGRLDIESKLGEGTCVSVRFGCTSGPKPADALPAPERLKTGRAAEIRETGVQLRA